MNTKTLFDRIDEFGLLLLSAKSMAHILEDLILESRCETTIELSDPENPIQKMHACLVAIRNQLNAMETTVHEMGSSNE